MGLWYGPLLAGLIYIAQRLVARVLVSLGMGYVAYEGVTAAIEWAEGVFVSGVSGLPAAAVQIAGLLQVGTCVSMLMAAVTARMVLRGLSGGTLKRLGVTGG